MLISEHFAWDEDEAGRRDTQLDLSAPDSGLRCILQRAKWEIVAEDIKAEFNRRLKNDGLKPGRWKTGVTPLARTLGKELVVLAWGIESADVPLIPTAVRNWQGLTPEERWWLYTMTNAATGHPTEGRNKGWRKAIRFALTENPVGDVPLLDRNTFGVSLARGRETPRKAKKQLGGPSLFDGEI